MTNTMQNLIRMEPASPPAASADAKLALLLAESEKTFNSELSRMDALTHKAEKYLTAVSILAGIYLADILPTKSPAGPKSLTYSALLLGALTLLAAALTLILFTFRVREYRSYPRGDKLLKEVCAPEVTANAARIMFSSMYSEAFNVNARINDRRARLLARGGALLVAGFVLAAASHLLAKF